MSRNSSIRFWSGLGFWRPIHACPSMISREGGRRAASVLLAELVRRHRDGDLARLGIVPVGQRVHGPIGRAGQHAQDQQDPKERGHRVNRFDATIALKEWKNYDHVLPAV